MSVNKISVYPRPVAEAIEMPTVPHLIISISTPGDELATLKTNDHTVGLIMLQFYDMDRVIEGYNEEYAPGMFKQRDAERILELVQSCPTAEEIVVHCDAGMSRSPGVAAALAKVLFGDDSWWFKRHSGLNRLVYRTILEVHAANEETEDGNDCD